MKVWALLQVSKIWPWTSRGSDESLRLWALHMVLLSI